MKQVLQISLSFFLASLVLILLASPQHICGQVSSSTQRAIDGHMVHELAERSRVLPKGAPVNLDEDSALNALAAVSEQAVGRGQLSNATDQIVNISLPLGEGGAVVEFELSSAGVFSLELQAQFPDIRAYRGIATDGSGMSVRLEYSPSQGFTAASYEGFQRSGLLRASVDVATASGQREYEYYRSEDLAPAPFSCETESPELTNDNRKLTAYNRGAGDCKLRRYRLAVACTGEYSQAVGGATPTKASVLAAVNVAVNRVTEIYERDLAITLQLSSEEANVIFLDPMTDPFSGSAAEVLMEEGQIVIDSVLGSAAYDVGHLFTTGLSGRGVFRSVCDDTKKAKGISGTPNPTGDGFYIDFVAHELGHQFGATHTFSNSCNDNRTAATAYEPGSGSTIMGYAGICFPNVQESSDPYFHAASLAQIATFVDGSGGDCAVLVDNFTNRAPTVSTSSTALLIPIGTCFELRAVGADPDGDALTYVWEQYDLSQSPMQPLADTNRTGPLFRSLPPMRSPVRRFPDGRFPNYEILPSVARTMNFRVTVRDNAAGGGCTAQADVVVNTTATAGPFRITSYPAAAMLEGNSEAIVTWDVAGTSVAPLGVQLVDVLWSPDGGTTRTIVLAAGTANTGRVVVAVPNQATTRGRFIVRAVNSAFFAVSEANLTVVPVATNSFTLTSISRSDSTCTGDAVAFELQLKPTPDFNLPIQLSVTGLPEGLAAQFSANGEVGSFNSALTLAGADTLAPGTYSFQVLAEAGQLTRRIALTLTRLAAPPAPPVATNPADGASDGLVSTKFSWDYSAAQGKVKWRLSQNPSFPASSTIQRELELGEVVITGLAAGVYYWQVAYVNPCGTSEWSDLRSLRRIPLEVETYAVTTALPISTGDSATYRSTVDVARSGSVYRMEVAANIRHTYVGDLDAYLLPPGIIQLPLFSRIGDADCEGDNIVVRFADDAAATIDDTEGVCASAVPAVSGTFKPIEPFTSILPREGAGTYTLRIKDYVDFDGGSLDSWSLKLWFDASTIDETSITSNTVVVRKFGERVVPASLLRASAPTVPAGQYTWVVKQLPSVAQVLLGGQPVVMGSTFTQTQVDTGGLSIRHRATDSIGVSTLVLDLVGPNASLRANVALAVLVKENTLDVTLSRVADLLCAGDLNAAVGAEVTGGAQPYTYSLNGTAFVSDGMFAGLGAGRYSVRVRDGDGFEASTDTLSFTAPTLLEVAVSADGSTVVASATGGTGAYRYSLDAGVDRASGTFNNVADGTYVVTATDANGCTATGQVKVSTIPDLVLSLEVVRPILCAGGTGTVRALAAGGISPYSYWILSGTPQSSNVFASLPRGTYEIRVVDAIGTEITQSIALVAPPALAVSASASDRVVTASASGGTPGYSYSIDGVSYQAGNSFSNLSNGTYIVTVRDANACTTTASATVRVNDVSVRGDVLSNTSCFNSSTGSVEATATGGTAPYTYTLDGGTAQRSSVFTQLPAGFYDLVAIDADGLRSPPTSLRVTQPTPLVIETDVVGPDITLRASGGTAPYTFRRGDAAFSSQQEYGPLESGTYSFTVRDANGCTANTSASVRASALGVAVAFNLAQESCPDADDGAVTLSGVSGLPPYVFSLDGVVYREGSFFGSLAPGEYMAYVKDANGTVSTTGFSIEAQAAPTYEVIVEGSRVTVANLSIAGGGVRYSFDGGTTYTVNSSGFFYEAGTKEVLIRYGSCQLALDVPVSNPLQLNVADIVLCDLSTLLATSACVEGGVEDYAVSVSAGAATQVASNDCRSAWDITVPTGITVVEVAVEDATGARIAKEFAVTAANPLVINPDYSGGTLSVKVLGGSRPYSYSLDGGATVQQDSTFSNLEGLTETAITVIDANGCSQTEMFMLSGTTDVGAAIGLKVWPNPVAQTLRVQVADYPGMRQVRLLSLDGRQVLAKAEPSMASVKLEVGALAPGYYTLEVEHEQGRAHIAVIVEH